MSVHGMNSRVLVTPRPGDAVKARIVATGVRLCDLATAAGVSRQTISNCIHGLARRPETQYDIYCAFVRLSGSGATIYEFWGPLFHGRKVAI